MAEALNKQTKITFSKVKTGVENQFLRVYGASKKNVMFKLPKMKLPYGVQKDNFSAKVQYTIDLSFKNNSELLESFEIVNKSVIEFAHKEIFKGKTLDEVAAMYVSPIKGSKSEYDPTLRVKIVPNKDNDKLKVDFFLSEKNAEGKFPKVNFEELGGEGYITTLLKKGTSCETVIEAIALWVRADTFGLSFKLHQAKVFSTEEAVEEDCDFESDSEISDAEWIN